MKYLLRASNTSGASVEFRGETCGDAMRSFRNEYNQSGFVVSIWDENGKKVYFRSFIKEETNPFMDAPFANEGV